MCRLVLATTESQREAVKQVLDEFFVLTPAGWINSRADAEIDAMRDKQQKQRDKANKRWHKPESEQTSTPAMPQHEVIDAVASNNDADAMPPTPTPTPTPIEIPPIPPVGANSGQTSKKPKTPAVSFLTWIETVKASGEKPIPEDDPVFSYAAEVRIPQEFLRLGWREFRNLYSKPGAKRYSDWREVFRKSIRGNWLKLWWIDSNGEYALTTSGKQAEMAAAAS